MGATNKILAKRVDELTEGLIKAHDGMQEALASGDLEGLEENCDHLRELLGIEGIPEDSDEEDELDDDIDDEEVDE